MGNKIEAKSFKEYREDLEPLVSKDILNQFDQYVSEDRMIEAIRMLKKYGVFSYGGDSKEEKRGRFNNNFSRLFFLFVSLIALAIIVFYRG